MWSALRHRGRAGTSQAKPQQHEQADGTASVASFELHQQQDPTPEVKHAVFVGKYDYDSRTDDQLSFKKGDLMDVTNMDNDGWWLARFKDSGREGYIPSNYVAEWKTLDAEE